MRRFSAISSFSRRVLALSMAVCLLFSGMGFSYSAHYCSDELRSWAVFGETEACEMPAVKSVKCPSHENMVIQIPNNCCEDHDISVERQSHEASLISADVLQDAYAIGLPPIAENYRPITLQKEESLIPFERPPPIDEDIYILVQSFLL